MPHSKTEMAPHDKEAEQGVLGAVLHDNSALDDVRGRIRPEQFYSPAHRDIYQAMLDLRRGETPIDEITLGAHMKSNGRLEKVGGQLYLMELLDLVPVTANVLVYAEIVEEKWQRRKYIDMAAGLQDAGGDPRKAEEVRVGIEALATAKAAFTTQTGSGAAQEFWGRFQQAERDGYDSVKTYTPLDQWINGLEPGFPTFIGARSANGKTTFVMQVAMENILTGRPVLVVSLEMYHWQVIARMACNLGAVDGVKVLKGLGRGLQDADMDRLVSATDRISGMPLYLFGNGKRQTLEQIAYAVRHHVQRSGVGLVVIDHLRKISPPGGKSFYDDQSARAEGVTAIAKEAGVPVLCAAQINRSGDDAPRVIDLEGSGVIEQEADVVVLLQAFKATGDGGYGGTRAYINAHLAKVRNGPEERVVLDWDPQFFRVGGVHNENPGV